MKIRAEDAAILLYGALRVAKNRTDYGHLDAFKSLDEYRQALSFNLEVSKDIVEGCLYGLSLLEPDGHFWHPQFRSLSEFIKSILPSGYKYDTTYSVIELKD